MSPTTEVSLVVNGVPRRAACEDRRHLADFLRHDLGLTGTHVGCEHGACGACTVQVDGEAVRACLLLAAQAEGCEVRTLEGLAAPDGSFHPLQAAFRAHHGLQCGFCTPGILMMLEAYLREEPDPDEAALREALTGNVCRCTGYQAIVDAALAAARAMRGAA